MRVWNGSMTKDLQQSNIFADLFPRMPFIAERFSHMPTSSRLRLSSNCGGQQHCLSRQEKILLESFAVNSTQHCRFAAAADKKTRRQMGLSL